jgi:hypothetical protein
MAAAAACTPVFGVEIGGFRSIDAGVCLFFDLDPDFDPDLDPDLDLDQDLDDPTGASFLDKQMRAHYITVNLARGSKKFCREARVDKRCQK